MPGAVFHLAGISVQTQFHPAGFTKVHEICRLARTRSRSSDHPTYRSSRTIRIIRRLEHLGTGPVVSGHHEFPSHGDEPASSVGHRVQSALKRQAPAAPDRGIVRRQNCGAVTHRHEPVGPSNPTSPTRPRVPRQPRSQVATRLASSSTSSKLIIPCHHRPRLWRLSSISSSNAMTISRVIYSVFVITRHAFLQRAGAFNHRFRSEPGVSLWRPRRPRLGPGK
jgi:hypothetical protein